MTAVLFAVASAIFFGGMTVAIRVGLRGGGGNAATAALATLLWATAVALVAALPRHDLHRFWQFVLAGLIAPGCSQVLFTLSVRDAGPSRTSVAVGAAPLLATGLAFSALGEPVRAPLVAGALVIVAGGAVLASEPDRPEHVRLLALLYAVFATVFFAVRDNLIRALHAHASPLTAATATCVGGMLISALWARRPPATAELRRFAPAGVLFGLSYVCLFEAYFHGRVSVVSPLVATESLWGVGLALIVFRHAEGVGRRVVVGALLVVAGGALIGTFR